MTDPGPERPDAQISCALCGTTVDSLPLTWSTSWGPRGRNWSCEGCTRQHLRAMEARLDEEHW